MMSFDLLILNGYVIDGSGSRGKKSDVGITGDKITAIGNLSNRESKKVIDAAGLVVCPGFIDVHVHSELALLGGKDQFAPLKMGVTTQLTGPDGFSWVPMENNRWLEMKEYLNVFYDYDILPQDFNLIRSIEDYISLFTNRVPSNLVLQVPHGSIRGAVMGWENRKATEDEIKTMEGIVHKWMKAGAKAFCTGLEYEPTRHADTNELIRLSKVAASYGGIYVAHQRGYMENVNIGCTETFKISREANIPVHISHFTVTDEAQSLLDKAKAEGLDVTFDMYPYTAGCTHLMYALPDSWQKGPPREILNRLADKEIRSEIAEHVEQSLNMDRAIFASVGTPYPSGMEGKTLREVYESSEKEFADFICDLLLESNLQVLMVYHWPTENIPYLQQTFKHDLHMVSTDGVYVGKKPHPRGFGTYPKVFRELVYENKVLSLEEAIYKMTGFPASRFQIEHRGLLQKDYFADIIIFDSDTIDSNATFENPRSDPKGIAHIIVNGKHVIEQGKINQIKSGRVIS